MAKLEWDKTGERLFETGTKNGVLYVYDADKVSSTTGPYTPGVAWNGLTGVTESPSGAEATALYADDIKYLNLYSAEELGATINAYTYPDEFGVCDGSEAVTVGSSAPMMIGQQSRKTFGLCYRTSLGNDLPLWSAPPSGPHRPPRPSEARQAKARPLLLQVPRLQPGAEAR